MHQIGTAFGKKPLFFFKTVYFRFWYFENLISVFNVVYVNETEKNEERSIL